MNYIKNAIYGPDPAAQKRECQSLIRKNQRELDKQISQLSQSENKTKIMVKQVVKRNDLKSARLLAKELYKSKKQKQRLFKSKAQLNSVSLQVNEAFAMRKIEGTMKVSTGVMKDMNSLIRLPELTATMNSLGKELVKAGIIEDMVGDTMDLLDENEMFEDSEAEDEVNAILSEITGTPKLAEAGHVPEGFVDEKTSAKKQTVGASPSAPTAVGVEDDSDGDEEMLNSMRERLKALQS
ncbi:uncharacterized protein SAPINGB_P001941 [Magnusiomyces paraingens]|uniref:Vacuolar protein-sorting-associated protein 24 n=1 Tax=Magnusiomyces paraingens TaxID=2606893 RepID=A0A5E8BGZ7_9ASCO|nr:uncharacterized protein SAPINGB_P001941 [Saprochaete ingens]VVT48767.1 unnamed protein product [Saprochaete ingens]